MRIPPTLRPGPIDAATADELNDFLRDVGRLLRGFAAAAPLEVRDDAGGVAFALNTAGLGGGGGTVTDVSSGNLSPLFTVTVSTPTTTPTFGFAAVNQGPNAVYASPDGSSGAPSFRSLVAADFATVAAHQFLAGPTSGGAVTPSFRAIVAGDLPTADATHAGIVSLSAQTMGGGDKTFTADIYLSGAGGAVHLANGAHASAGQLGTFNTSSPFGGGAKDAVYLQANGGASINVYENGIDLHASAVEVNNTLTISTTITLAKLTTGGSNGSVTIVCGMVTAYTAPT